MMSQSFFQQGGPGEVAWRDGRPTGCAVFLPRSELIAGRYGARRCVSEVRRLSAAMLVASCGESPLGTHRVKVREMRILLDAPLAGYPRAGQSSAVPPSNQARYRGGSGEAER